MALWTLKNISQITDDASSLPEIASTAKFFEDQLCGKFWVQD